MASQKNTKPLDLSLVKAFVDSSGGPAVGAMAPLGTTTRPPIELIEPVEPLTFERIWSELPAATWWEILQRGRVKDLCPHDTKAEWRRYHELLRRSPLPWSSEIFVGLETDLDDKTKHRPMFVPRRVFEHHAYILGLPGTGKTAQALAQLLLQLSEDYVDDEGAHQPKPPLLIIDLKEGGDNYLRSLANQTAEARNQTLRFFSNDPDYVSLKFDPLYSLRSIQYPLKRAETILKALSLIYKEGYGSDFFTAEQHTQLLRTLYDDDPKTLAELIRFVDGATRGSKKNKDARGLYSALAPLQYSFHLLTDQVNPRTDDLLDLDRFYENGEVLYVHLNSRSQSIDAKVIGKLVIFALMEVAAERKKRGTSRQVFVAIDEFQRLAAQNIVEVLEDSRSLKVGFVLSHQSPESLRTRETDLYRMIADLCSYKQFLSLTSSNIVEQLQLVSGRKIERRLGGSEGTSKGTSSSDGTTDGNSTTSGSSKSHTYGWFSPSTTTDGVTHSSGDSHSRSRTTGKNEGTTSTSTWKEEAVAGLTPEAIAAVNGTPLLSLIHVHATKTDSATPLGGIPTLVEGLYPFVSDEAKRMRDVRWDDKVVDRATFIEKVRPHVPRNAVDQLKTNKKGRGKPPKPAPAATGGDDGEVSTEEHKERRELRRRIRELAKRLGDHILPEARRLHDLSKWTGASFAELKGLAAEHGVQVEQPDDVIPARVVRAISRQLPAPPQPGDEKDNGPPQESAV